MISSTFSFSARLNLLLKIGLYIQMKIVVYFLFQKQVYQAGTYYLAVKKTKGDTDNEYYHFKINFKEGNNYEKEFNDTLKLVVKTFITKKGKGNLVKLADLDLKKGTYYLDIEFQQVDDHQIPYSFAVK